MFLGRLHPIKRVELLIEAAVRLREQGTPVQLLIAGSGETGYEATLREMAIRGSLADHVWFLGFVTGTEKLSLCQAADIVVSPSAHESFGYSLVEALACGTPVVTTKAVNIWPELQQTGGAAICEGNAAAIAAAINGLLSDRQALSQMGQRGRQGLHAWLEPARVISMYEAMYADCIKSR